VQNYETEDKSTTIFSAWLCTCQLLAHGLDRRGLDRRGLDRRGLDRDQLAAGTKR
jgi:hypothetical protein